MSENDKRTPSVNGEACPHSGQSWTASLKTDETYCTDCKSNIVYRDGAWRVQQSPSGRDDEHPMVHRLKTWRGIFSEVVEGRKTYEIRKEDRPYEVGDTLVLQEYDQILHRYTGREHHVLVTYKTDGGQWGLPDDICVMGIAPIAPFAVAQPMGQETFLAWKDQDDKPLPEDDAIENAFPTRTGRHDLYGEAMRLVGARYSKGGLVALVNWLLFRFDTAPLTRDDIEQDRPACIEDLARIAKLVPHDSEVYRIAAERLSVLKAFEQPTEQEKTSRGGRTSSSETSAQAPADVTENHAGCEGALGPEAEHRVLSPVVPGSSPGSSFDPARERPSDGLTIAVAARRLIDALPRPWRALEACRDLAAALGMIEEDDLATQPAANAKGGHLVDGAYLDLLERKCDAAIPTQYVSCGVPHMREIIARLRSTADGAPKADDQALPDFVRTAWARRRAKADRWCAAFNAWAKAGEDSPAEVEAELELWTLRDLYEAHRSLRTEQEKTSDPGPKVALKGSENPDSLRRSGGASGAPSGPAGQERTDEGPRPGDPELPPSDVLSSPYAADAIEAHAKDAVRKHPTANPSTAPVFDGEAILRHWQPTLGSLTALCREVREDERRRMADGAPKAEDQALPDFVVRSRAASDMGRPAGEWQEEGVFADFAAAQSFERDVLIQGWRDTQIVARPRRMTAP